MEIRIDPAVRKDVYPLARNMREEDVFEAKMLFDMSPLQAAKYSFKNSAKAFTIRVDGVVAAMYGVNPSSALTDYGIIWMLSTKLVDKHPLHVVRYLKPKLLELCEGYDEVYNFVSARNVKMINYLQSLGFMVDEAEKSGVYGQPFRRFHKVV